MLLTQGEASDVILVVNNNNNNTTTTTLLACSDFYVQFSDTNNDNTTNRITITVNGSLCDDSMNMDPTENGARFIRGNNRKPPSLTSLYEKLVLGKNMIRYSFVNNTTNQVLGIADANLFVWDYTSNIIVCDIDGTITKSNARGVFDTMVLESYVYAHDGVCEFLSKLKHMDECIQILYLTSRPLSYAPSTRRFLQGLRQDAQHKLPQGPLFMHPKTIGSVLFSELVSKDVHMYKSDTLLRQVVLVFAAAGRSDTDNLLISGFGNTLADSVAYEMAGISRQDIYMIDKKSQINCMNRDVDDTILEHVKVNSQGSLVLSEDSDTTDDSSRSEQQNATSQRQVLKRQSSRKLRKSLHRQYTQLIGSSYNGYHDPRLLVDVTEKIRVALELGTTTSNSG
jgi:phosphatidate phosphatase PAH1